MYAIRSYYVVRTPNGCSWGIKAFPMRDEKGQIVSVIHLASDITEKIRMREETERSGRLASLGQLAAGVAHEINNPNALILHNIPILKETWADVEAILDEFHRITSYNVCYTKLLRTEGKFHHPVYIDGFLNSPISLADKILEILDNTLVV